MGRPARSSCRKTTLPPKKPGRCKFLKKVKMISKTACLISLVWLWACSSYPPAGFENGRYVNPAYHFSLQIPEGWRQISEMPEWVQKYALLRENRHNQLMLNSADSHGFIVVQGIKSRLDLADMPSSEIQASFVKILSERAKAAKGHARIQDYGYTIEQNAFDGDPRPLFREQWTLRHGYMQHRACSSTFLYGCHRSETCKVRLILVSDRKFFDRNYRGYTELLDSLDKTGGGPDSL